MIMQKGTIWATLKTAKKVWFPEAPHSWVRHTVGAIEFSQDWSSKRSILRLKEEDYKPCTEDEKEDKYLSHLKEKLQNRYKDANAKEHEEVDYYKWSWKNSHEILHFLGTHTTHINETDAEDGNLVVEVGKSFDIVSLLLRSCFGDGAKEKGYLVRNNGEIVGAESLKGNNILVCCFYVPVFWLTLSAGRIQQLQARCSEICSGKWEIVIVARMRRQNNLAYGDEEEAFNQFLSGFPSSCLAVPFSDKGRRDLICKSLGLVSDPQALLVDSNLEVLVHKSIPNCTSPVFYYDNSVDYYWWESHSELDSLLDCNPCDLVYNMSCSSLKIPISQLKEKLVGLYLCRDGGFLRALHVIHQECKARNWEFEVVLVYLPYDQGANPELFEEAINTALHNLEISPDWWVSPFNNRVSLRLWHTLDHCYRDELIIVGPRNDPFVDPYARPVIFLFGIDAYPFTREGVVDMEFDAIRNLNVESLLVYGSRDYVLRWDSNSEEFDQVPVKQLLGKTVLVYIDNFQSMNLNIYDPLLEWYQTQAASGMTTIPSDIEVVFVFVCGGDEDASDVMPLPWLLCPFDPQHSASFSKNIMKHRGSVLAAFDRDGQIVSVHAEKLLPWWPDGFSFYGGLRDEVYDDLEKSYGRNLDMRDMCF